MQFKKPDLNARQRRLASALTIEDLRGIASGAHQGPRSTTPRAPPRRRSPWPGPGRRSRTSSSSGDPARRVEGDAPTGTCSARPVALPFGIAPTGFTRMMQTEGEIAGPARPPGRASRSRCRRWARPRSKTSRQPTRTGATGSSCTCGRTATGRWRWSSAPPRPGSTRCSSPSTCPVAGARLRDKRNGFSIPPQLTLRHRAQRDPAAVVVDRLPDHRAAGVRVARPLVGHGRRAARHHVRPDRHLRRPRLDQVAVAGQGRRQGRADPRRREARWPTSGWTASCCRITAAASSTGHPMPFHLLPDVVREVGSDIEVHLDTGIMSGADIVAAVALGARFTLVGRAYLYGLMAGGRGRRRPDDRDPRRADRTHHAAARGHLLEELTPEHVTQLVRLAPRSLT